MKRPFAKLIAVSVLGVAAASAQAGAATPDIRLDSPVALSLPTADFRTLAPAREFGTPISLLSSGDVGAYALGSAGDLATTSGRTWDTSTASGAVANVVPLPEPSSETALYFLSGVVGLALVVMRRRTLA